MADFILEPGDPAEAEQGNAQLEDQTTDPKAEGNDDNVAPEQQQEAAAKEEEGKKEEGEKEAPEDDGTRIQIGDREYTLAEIEEMEQAYQNKEKWQASNTQKAQETAEKRRYLDQLLERIQANPALLAQMQGDAKPAPAVAANEPSALELAQAELDKLYESEPQDPFSEEAKRWSREKDAAIRKVARYEAAEEAKNHALATTANEFNLNLARSAYDKYSKELGEDAYFKMEEFVSKNLRQDENGKYPANSFEVAKMVLFADQVQREQKLETSQKIGRVLQEGSRSAGARGGQKTVHVKVTQEEQEDVDFVQAVKERMSVK